MLTITITTIDPETGKAKSATVVTDRHTLQVLLEAAEVGLDGAPEDLRGADEAWDLRQDLDGVLESEV